MNNHTCISDMAAVDAALGTTYCKNFFKHQSHRVVSKKVKILNWIVKTGPPIHFFSHA